MDNIREALGTKEEAEKRRIRIICTVYGKSVNDIRSLKNFITFCEAARGGAEIYIYDNSEDSELNRSDAERLCGTEFIHYVWNGSNIGLSRSFNKALHDVPEKEMSATWLLFADDDTEFSITYLQNVRKLILSDKPEEIITGIIREKTDEEESYQPEGVEDKGFIVSPMGKNAIFKGHRNPVRYYGIYRNIYAINSGLVIRGLLLNSMGGFNEELFLDMIDYELMDRLRDEGKNRIAVVPGRIRQDLSGMDFGDSAAAKMRFRTYKQDFSTYCRVSEKPLHYRIIIPLKRRINIKLHS